MRPGSGWPRRAWRRQPRSGPLGVVTEHDEHLGGSVGADADPSRSVGACARVRSSRMVSCSRISASSAWNRFASVRSECFSLAIGEVTAPGRSDAHRSMRALSDRPARFSRSSAGAVTMSALSVTMALICRIISADSSADFGIATACPPSTARAAASASRVSLLPLLRRLRRSPRLTSMTRCPARRSKLARPTP